MFGFTDRTEIKCPDDWTTSMAAQELSFWPKRRPLGTLFTMFGGPTLHLPIGRSKFPSHHWRMRDIASGWMRTAMLPAFSIRVLKKNYSPVQYDSLSRLKTPTTGPHG